MAADRNTTIRASQLRNFSVTAEDLKNNSITGDKLIDGTISGSKLVLNSIDHGGLGGLSDDDHTQYLLADGTRAFTGNIQANASGTLDIGSSAVPFRDLYLDGNVHVDNTPTASGTYTGGITTTVTIDANTVGFGAALHIDTDGNFIEADASGATTMPCDVLAVEAGTGSKKVLLQGFIRDDSWSWTVGGTIYVSVAAGGLTQTAPSASGEQVQAIGRATVSNTFYFNPDYTVLEIA